MSRLQCLIFDVDGTLADTEEAHRTAFNHAFTEAGLDWHWDVALYTRLLNISGGKERMLHYWQSRPDAPQDISGNGVQDTLQQLHDLKTAVYEAAVKSGAVSLRPGVLSLLQQAGAAGLQLAIATTTSPVNIAALLSTAMGPDWRYHFTAIGDASTAPIKKPHPQVYLQMLQAMKLRPEQCLAFEDSGNGLRAASAAGLATIITPTHFTLHHDFSQAVRVVPDLSQVNLATLMQWHVKHLTRQPAEKAYP